MTTPDTQTVAKSPDDAGKQTSEGKGAQGKGDDLDEILSEIAAESRTDEPPKKPEKAPDEGKKADPDLRELVKGIYTRDARRDLKTAIGSMKEEAEPLKALPDSYIESLIGAEARRDRRIITAWNNRETDPETWDKVLPRLARKIANGLGGTVDEQLTKDREAVVESVRGKTPGTGGGSDKVNLAAMSDAEFAAYKRSLPKRR